MSRRKGTPCACNSDPCGCNSRSDCIRTVNGEYPDPNRNLNVKAGAGIQIVPAEHGIEIINISDPDAFQAGDNIEIIDNADGTRSIRLADDIVRTGDTDLTGDVDVTGDLTVNGNIIQNGAYYDTHAEHIYTRDDYIIMRDGAIAALAAGDYSGFQVKLYDGVNDGRLVIDNTGTARVGDVGDEQPLLTREESANLNDGALLKWDAANSKAIDEGTVGSDTKPIKIVNGVAVAVTNSLFDGKSKLVVNTTQQEDASIEFEANSVPKAGLLNMSNPVYPTINTYGIRLYRASDASKYVDLRIVLRDNGTGRIAVFDQDNLQLGSDILSW